MDDEFEGVTPDFRGAAKTMIEEASGFCASAIEALDAGDLAETARYIAEAERWLREAKGAMKKAATL